MKHLYAYTDFRAYLRDFYQEMKKSDSRFSYQRFSKAAGIKSPNYLKLVMDGGRDLTILSILQFAKALKLTEAETEYFESLVHLGQATTPLEKTYYKTKSLKIKSARVEHQDQVKLKQLGRYPFLPAILVSCGGLEEPIAAQVLASKFKLPIKQVTEILAQLIQAKMIEVDSGQFKLKSDYYVQFDKVRSSSDQQKFLKAQLKLSEQALDRRYGSDAQFFSHTFTTLASRMPRMIEKMADLLEDLTRESNDDPAERVMQLNIQFFPLAMDSVSRDRAPR